MAPEIHRSGTITLLFTDLVGSTEALERMGDEAVVRMTVATLEQLGEITSAHRGQVVKLMGDGIMAAFPSAVDAATAAVAMQRSTVDEYAQAEHRLRTRVGVHTGEPMRVGDDYYGLPVVIASRMCYAASDGQIVVSDVVHGLVASRDEFAFQDLGERVFRGISSPMRVWELAWRDGGAVASHAPAGERRPAHVERPPDTVVILYADIVDSVPHTERLGDAAFRERSHELDSLLRANVQKHRGTTVEGKLVGDGILAIFPSARDAINSALECGALGDSVDLELHLGLHAGDVIRDGNNIYGGAVNIAARIGMATKPGEILVSDTVRGLARTSAGVRFEDRGEYALKGIDERLRLFAPRPQ